MSRCNRVPASLTVIVFRFADSGYRQVARCRGGQGSARILWRLQLPNRRLVQNWTGVARVEPRQSTENHLETPAHSTITRFAEIVQVRVLPPRCCSSSRDRFRPIPWKSSDWHTEMREVRPGRRRRGGNSGTRVRRLLCIAHRLARSFFALAIRRGLARCIRTDGQPDAEGGARVYGA